MKRVMGKTELKVLSDTLKLIKSAYPKVIYITRPEDNMVVFTNSTGVNPIFKYSHFTHVKDNIPVEMTSSLIDVEVLYNALKDKMESIEVRDNGSICAENSKGQVYIIGHKTTEVQTSNIMGMALEGFKVYYNIISSIDHLAYTIYEYKCTAENISRLVNYETVTFRPDPESSIGLILTCKCFPNIKKCRDIQIQWLCKDDEGKFYFIVSSSYMDNKPIGFVMVGEALRC